MEQKLPNTDELFVPREALETLPVANPPLNEVWQSRRALRRWSPVNVDDLRRAVDHGGDQGLTWEEYVDVSMHGESGYYNKVDGGWSTNTHLIWPRALVGICEKYNLGGIVEVGFGKGELMEATVGLIAEGRSNLTYRGLEKNQQITTRLVQTAQRNLEVPLAGSVDDLVIEKPTLVVYPYCLSSMPTRCFTHIGRPSGPVNGEIVVRIQGKDAYETIERISTDEVEKRLNRNIKNLVGSAIDLSRSRLDHGQRAYLPLQMALHLTTMLSALPSGSRLLIIDEFGPEHREGYDFGVPRTIGSWPLDTDKLSSIGRIPVYTPIEATMFHGLLRGLGLRTEISGRESVVINRLVGKNTSRSGPHDNSAILTTPINVGVGQGAIDWSLSDW